MAGISSEELSAAAGIVLSLGFSYIPGVSQRFDGLTPTQKRLAMLGLLLACALGVFLLSCANSGVITAPACDRSGAWGLAKVFIAALIANQAAFTISPRGRERNTAGPSSAALQNTTPRKIYKRRPVSRMGVQSMPPPDGISSQSVVPSQSAVPTQSVVPTQSMGTREPPAPSLKGRRADSEGTREDR